LLELWPEGATSLPSPGPLPSRELDSRIAYRDTDREVNRAYAMPAGSKAAQPKALPGPKPLSASFDRLGNNATVAMMHAAEWRRDWGFAVLPMHAPLPTGRDIIEVYPALLKRRGPEGGGKILRAEASAALQNAGHLLAQVGSDAHDAALCALMAVAFRAEGACGLPRLVGPQQVPGTDWRIVCQEGWIYYPAPDWT
jgi:hypothetical protein